MSSKVGHFYRMTQAENTYIFQHYLVRMGELVCEGRGEVCAFLFVI